LLLTLCREFFPEGDFLVGLAGKPRSLKELCASLGEAERACQGSLFGRKEHVVHFQELGYGTLLDPQNPRWKSFMRQTLEPLLGEEEKNAALLDSLETLLEYSSIPDASRALHVHPNTLNYRKRQIEKLLEKNLQDPSVRTNLLLALKTHRLQRMEEEESDS
jgi:DNA-binding PucR family transcriptional regulator